MAVVRPFKAIVYNTDRVSIEDVVAPPYDVINERMQEELYSRSPYNVVRLILGRVYPEDDDGNNRYTRARSFLQSWLSEGVLKELGSESFFVYRQEFEYEGRSYTRMALIGRVRLEDYGGSIIPHEKTLSSPKEDRLKLLRTTRTNLSPVFGIALDDGSLFENMKGAPLHPLFEFEDAEGVVHSLSQVAPDEITNARIMNALVDKKILIADGHHRYETALRYKREQEKTNPNHTGEEPYNFVMMAIVSSKDPGLLVLPIHRVLKNTGVPGERLEGILEERFGTVERVDEDGITHITDVLKRYKRRCFCRYVPHRGSVFRIEDGSDELDVVLLHRKVIHETLGITEEEIRDKKKIEYYKNIHEALEFLERKGDILLSYLPPTVEEIARYSLSGKIMPQKSTYFYPKFYSGLLFYRLED